MHHHTTKLIQIYKNLPSDAQQCLLERHVSRLLDTAPKHTQKRLLASAIDIQSRYTRMPRIDLKAKKTEINTLLHELARDNKRSVIKERSRREQLLSEAVDSIAHWLSDVWCVAFEFRTDFARAHACLLFACEALDQIGNACGGCKCSYASMFISLKIKRSSGKIVKSFVLDGAHALESVILWIWRDMFIAILAIGSPRQKCTVPVMIDDIRDVLGWRALELLLRGGSAVSDEDDEDDEGEDEDEDDSDIVDDDGDQNYISDDCSIAHDDDDDYPTSLYPAHWSFRMTSLQPRLRSLVHNALLNVFKVAPTGPLYSSMVAIAGDPDELEEEIHPLLMAVAGHSSENLSTALRILALNNETESINTLLHAHKHLLRPQDASSLQFAVLILSSHFFYRPHALSIVEEELVDASTAFGAAMRISFCNMESENNKTELKRILALPESLTRRTRVERWVKGILTPQTDMPNPMALAALMFGIPIPPGIEGTDDGGDMLGYFELDGDDPDMEDLREEFRPNIKARWIGWVDTAMAIRGGQGLLSRVYVKVIGEMPFLGAKDVVEEMSSRLSDRPSKVHVSDALEALKEFCERQRVKRTAKSSRRTGPVVESVVT